MWLRADRPTNPLVIDTVLWCAEPLATRRVAAVLEDRLIARHPVFRQRVVEPSGLGLPCWQDDPDFRLDRHLTVGRLPAPGDQGALEAQVERCMRVPLDPTRPLWAAHLLHGFGAGSALVVRFHHAIADGVALMRVLLDLTDEAPDGDRVVRPAATAPVRGTPAPPPTRTVGAVGSVGAVGAVDAVRLVARGAGQVAALVSKVLLDRDGDTVLRTPPAIDKRAVWSRGRSLAAVRRVARANSATINDVLVSALAAGLHEYLAAHGGAVPRLTTLVPVNLRDPAAELPRTLGNRFALVFLPLPTGELSPLDRLAECKRRMDELKSSPEAAITTLLIAVLGRTPARLARPLVDFASGSGFGVTTNVQGPTSPRYLAGRRITGLLGWVPNAGAQTLGVCIVTYAGTVRVGLRLEAALPEPHTLLDAFERALTELEALTPQ